MINSVPDLRVTPIHSCPPNESGELVLYWMNSQRRMTWNYSLQQAVHWSDKLQKPLLVLETFSCDDTWASDRFLNFVTQGMQDNSELTRNRPVLYYPYIANTLHDVEELLGQLIPSSCVIVTDDFPTQPLPDCLEKNAQQHNVPLEAIDSSGLLPMKATDKVFSRAYDFRRYLQKNLLEHLEQFPMEDPLRQSELPRLEQLPDFILENWPQVDLQEKYSTSYLSQFPVDHSVPVVADITGGTRAANQRLQIFKDEMLPLYDQDRNQPEKEATSGFSPYLHYGHLSAHQIFIELTQSENWSPFQISESAKGSSSGWWGCSPSLEGFLDQLITWRELGFNFCSKRDDYACYESLPDWCQQSLAKHSTDPRSYIYSLAEFEAATTHDPLWNATQTQLVREGRIHNYLRMVWGKKILEWSESPQTALEIMIQLNNKYALDGQDPNSYSGIFWILGRFDRAWGPERPVFGKIRYMSSENTARKLKVKGYIKRYSEV